MFGPGPGEFEVVPKALPRIGPERRVVGMPATSMLW